MLSRHTWRAVRLLAVVGAFSTGGSRADDFIVGLGTHSAPDQGLALIQDAGLTSLRDDIHWAEVEREKGVLAMPDRYENYVAESLRRGIDPVLVLCYGNRFYDDGGFPISKEGAEAYARFATFVVSHFRGRVHRFEIWNEWNIAISMPKGTPHGPPESYVGLLRKVYLQLKAVDPTITVIGGALSGSAVEKGWLEAACRAGLLDNLDAFSFHPYCYRWGAVGRLPENGFTKQILDSREVVRRYQKREIPVYLTEIGWPNHDGTDGSTPAETAQFLARTYLLARTLPDVRGVWWYDLRDDGTDPHEREDHFGVTTRDFTPKPAYGVLGGICRLFRETRFVGEVRTVHDPDVHILRFDRRTGGTCFALWRSGEGGLTVVAESVSPAGQPKTKLTDVASRELSCEWKAVDARRWQLTVQLTGEPCLLENPPGAGEISFRADD